MPARRDIKLVGWAALAAFIAALVIMLPTVIALTQDVRSASLGNERRNCVSQATTRPLDNARAFAQREALTRLDVALRHFVGGFERQQDAQLDAAWQRELRRIRTGGRVPSGLPRHIRGFAQLSTLLGDLPLLNCSRQVG